MTGVDPATVRPKDIALFLDVDGTLLDFAPRPDEVEVPSALLEALRMAERRLEGALALVSGRPIADLDGLFAPLVLAASGVHGAEIRLSPDGVPTDLARDPLPEAALCELVRRLGDFPGTFVENKRFSFAVHHQARGAALARLVEALGGFIDASAPLALELVEGRRVFELKLRGFDKGMAIQRFMTQPPFLGRMPVFVADDELDRTGFAFVSAAGGLSFSVGGKLPGVSGWFAGPADVRAWLAGMSP